jgi:hypothetical protein
MELTRSSAKFESGVCRHVATTSAERFEEMLIDRLQKTDRTVPIVMSTVKSWVSELLHVAFSIHGSPTGAMVSLG